MDGSVRAAFAEALAFALPTTCAGCGAAGVGLCASCDIALAPSAQSADLDGMSVHWALAFEGEAAQAMRALKESGRTDAARPLGRALRVALEQAAGGRTGLVAVPVPARSASRRRRGYRAVELLLRRAGLRPHRALRLSRRVDDQRGLDRDGRRENVAEAFRASRRAGGLRVVVVDDVTTTGATLIEARRALRAVGAEVVGAAVVAATPRRRPAEGGPG